MPSLPNIFYDDLLHDDMPPTLDNIDAIKYWDNLEENYHQEDNINIDEWFYDFVGDNFNQFVASSITDFIKNSHTHSHKLLSQYINEDLPLHCAYRYDLLDTTLPIEYILYATDKFTQSGREVEKLINQGVSPQHDKEIFNNLEIIFE